MNDFKSILSRLLADKDLTQADLCRKTGIPTSLMSNYIKGSKSPALSNAILIAEALDISLDVLSGKSEYKSPASEVEAGDKNIFSDELMKNYRALNHKGRRKLIDYSKDLVSSGRYAAIKEDAG
ncbi:MAG TPA: XRE family transcriptional regulator [Ruminococcaceae bacterium]|jgi:transcriptional regulator with XRE-family HTH domain|nr:XRE family transcriptional regulator [Oscillospiraceae bacterium]